MRHKPLIGGLQLLINTDPPPKTEPLFLAEQAIAAGVDSIQLRHKSAYDRRALSLAFALSELCQKLSIPLIINDRIDIALATNASGVHLGQEDMPITIARELIGDDGIIGITVSTVEEAIEAENAGADYIGFGHIFPTQTKLKSYPPVGCDILVRAKQQIQIPILAIGGIHAGNAQQVIQTGVAGIAVVSAIGNALNPYQQTQQLKRAMGCLNGE